MSSNFSFSLLLSLVFLASAALSRAQSGGRVAVELWCVAKNNADDSALQTALSWACGPGGADCRPIQQGGPCYDPSDVQRTASFAFNNYFLNHGLSEDACNFAGTAALTSLNPSFSNCKFPSSFTVRNGSASGSTTVQPGPAVADLSSARYNVASWFLPWILVLLFSGIALDLL